MRVAVGAVAKRLLAELDMEIANHVVVFGGKEIDVPEDLTVAEIKERAAQSEVSIVNQEREQEIKDYIDKIKRDGDTIGGVVETVVGGVPVGLGSYVQWDRKLDARLAQAVVSLNAFKGVEFGLGFEAGVATVLAQEILEKFSSDNLEELKEAVDKHRDYTKNY